jgi:hypothetical protein
LVYFRKELMLLFPKTRLLEPKKYLMLFFKN